MEFPENLNRFIRTRTFAAVSLGAILAFLLFAYLRAEYWQIHSYGFGLDDSWIHATFARNLAEGKGYAFNPGENLSGSTAPLYTFLLAGWYAIFREVIWGSKLIGILSLAATGFFLYLALEKLTQSRFAAWMATALCFGGFPTLWSALVGMEIPVYFVTVSTALYFFAHGRYRWMIVALALGEWLRPEAGLLLALGWLAIPKKEKIPTAIIAALIILPYFALNYSLSGFPFPNTVRAKSALLSQHFGEGILTGTAQFFYKPHFAPLFLLVPFGIILLWKRAWWAAIFPPLFLVFIWANYTTSASFNRYIYPMLPFLYATMAAGVLWFARFKPRWDRPAKAIAVALVIVQLVFAYSLALLHGRAVENITHMQVSIAQVVPQITTPQDTIATNDIGALGYFSGRYVLDLVGLVSPVKSFEENLHQHHPAMLVIFDSWYPDRQQSPSFTQNYQPLVQVGLTNNVVCGDSVMSLYVRNDRMEDISTRLEHVSPH